MNLKDQVLAAIPFGDLTSIMTAAGLALIGLAFLGFVFRKATAAASGNPGGDSDEERRREEEEDR